jgi:hypothetical protein
MRNVHHVWRGTHDSVVVQVYHYPPGRWRSPLYEARPVRIRNEEDLWAGASLPGSRYADITRALSRADSCHFGFDLSGTRLASDTDGYAEPRYSFVFVGTYVEPADGDPFIRARYLLLPRTSWGKLQDAHPHPYLSPDGRYVVFQSDFTGHPEVHVAFDFEYPAADETASGSHP